MDAAEGFVRGLASDDADGIGVGGGAAAEDETGYDEVVGGAGM